MKLFTRLLPLAFALAACGGPDAAGPAPDFTLTALEGPTVTLSSLKGRVVLVNFWATWCDACKEELPMLNALQFRHESDRFSLIAVSVDEDAARVPPFAAAYGLKFPVLYADRKTMAAYAVRLLPTSFLIAPDGNIVRRYVGPLDAHAVENDILSLLNRRPS